MATDWLAKRGVPIEEIEKNGMMNKNVSGK
jgi:hypothetical protein